TGEIGVSTATTADTGSWVGVGMAANGEFVVAWTDKAARDGSSSGIFARRFSATGAPLWAETQVNTYTVRDQVHPSVAVSPDGTGVIAWQTWENDTSGSVDVRARRFNPAGFVGGEIVVANTPNVSEYEAAAASGPAGTFVVSYTLDTPTAGQEVRARVFRWFDGAALTDPLVVNDAVTAGNQFDPSVAADAAGNFVVTWTSAGRDADGNGIAARRFGPTGTPLGSEFQVNAYTTGSQERPAVSAAAAGNFVIAWASAGQDGSGYGTYMQRYNAAGQPAGVETQANAYTTDNQSWPAVGLYAGGTIAFATETLGQDGSDWGVSTRVFAEQPTTPSAWPEVGVNTFTAGNQSGPAVARNAAETGVNPPAVAGTGTDV
ncbi:MAG: hypothetical protein K2V38_08020, partial [Gemmataceae bacterium]|nr:hypothetical protein [Gemmataceae bacterium]